MIKKIVMALAGLTAAVMLSACGSPVPSGNVGVKFKMYGGDRGVQQKVLPPGRYWLGLGEELYVYPTFTKTISYCFEEVPGTDTTTNLTFLSSDNATVTGCIGMNYHAEESKVPQLFQRFRDAQAGDRTPLDAIAKTWLRQQLANSLNKHGGEFTAFELNGKREEVLEKVFQEVSAKATEAGIVIEQLSWLGPLHYPKAVQDSINATLAAIQEAERARQQLQTAEAQAKITVTEATAKADAIRIEAAAISANPQVLRLREIEKWNGEMPYYVGGGTGLYLPMAK